MAHFLSSLQISPVEWVFFYLIGAVFAIFVWHHHRAPKRPRTWFIYALCSVPAALIWLAYSRLGANLLFWQGEPNGSEAFDFAIAIIISPGLTVVAAIGFVRALAFGKSQ
jgi:uncharacterized membrane protein YwaF